MSKPITPDEVYALKTRSIPPEVFTAFNETIAKHWNGHRADFTQDEVIRSILARMPNTERHTLFENRWLDVEDSYRAHGWTVVYDKPAYCESYAASFAFTKAKP